jgi:outer membrane protein
VSFLFEITLLTFLFGLSLSSAHAQILNDLAETDIDIDTVSDVTEAVVPPGVSNIRLGLGPVTSPDYDGDDRYDMKPAPMVSLHYRDLILIDNNNIRINLFGKDGLFDSDRYRAGPLLKLDRGRKESDSKDLTGLGDVGTSIELGVFASYTYERTRARLRLQHDVISGHRGLRVIGDLRYIFINIKDLVVTSSASIEWANDDYMNSYFSITPEQSLRSGLPGFDAGPGPRAASLSVGANYAISRHWALVASVGYSRLLGDARKSPLIAMRGSSNQFRNGLFVVYVF